MSQPISRGESISFPLNRVIKGWTEGMQLVGQGGMIELEIPPDLAYGDRGAGAAVPPKATLHFLVELLTLQWANERRPNRPRIHSTSLRFPKRQETLRGRRESSADRHLDPPDPVAYPGDGRLRKKDQKDQAVVGHFELAPLPGPEMAKQTSCPGHDRIPIGTP